MSPYLGCPFWGISATLSAWDSVSSHEGAYLTHSTFKAASLFRRRRLSLGVAIMHAILLKSTLPEKSFTKSSFEELVAESRGVVDPHIQFVT